jgi:hypothetical protein
VVEREGKEECGGGVAVTVDGAAQWLCKVVEVFL